MIALIVASATRPDDSETITRSPTWYCPSSGCRWADTDCLTWLGNLPGSDLRQPGKTRLPNLDLNRFRPGQFKRARQPKGGKRPQRFLLGQRFLVIQRRPYSLVFETGP